MKEFIKKYDINLIKLILFICPFFVGMHSVISSVVLSIILLIAIITKGYINKKIMFGVGIKFWILAIWVISYLVVCFYAVDVGEASLGFLKMLSILFFVLLYLQYDFDEERKNNLFKTISFSGIAIILVTPILLLMPSFCYLFQSGRYQGFFMYANASGMWFLIGFIVLMLQKNISKKEIIGSAILFVGIILTSSRSIIILSAIAIVISFLKNKENRLSIAKILLIISVITCFALIIFGFSGIKNRMEETLSSSEFLTRFLYYNDAIKEILQHPFGLGYHGWWIVQSEHQTAIYDTMYVHNSLLQVALDVGIIPCAILMVLVISILFDKDILIKYRIIMCFVLLHSMIDFDFEFLAITYVLLMIPNYKTKSINYKVGYVLIIPLLILVYFCFPLFFRTINENKLAYKLYPLYTEAIREQMAITNDIAERTELANKAFKYNKYSSDIYEVFVYNAIKSGDAELAYEYERKLISINKYNMMYYINYLKFLDVTMHEYNDEKNIEYIKIYKERIIEIEKIIENVIKDTNPLVYKTQHKPRLEMPKEMKDYINQIKNYSL